MSSNLIADIAASVEITTKAQALKKLDELATNIEEHYFELGGLLLRIKDEGQKDKSWFDGHDSVIAFAHAKYGYQPAKTYRLMQVYESLVDKQIPGSVVSELGWTKTRMLSDVLALENLKEWVKKAKGLTVRELEALLKAKPDTGEKTINATDELVKFKFNLKHDQHMIVLEALSKAKAEFQVDNDAAAVAAICSRHLDGGVIPITEKSAKSVMQAAGWEECIRVYGELFPKIDLVVTVPEELSNPTALSPVSGSTLVTDTPALDSPAADAAAG